MKPSGVQYLLRPWQTFKDGQLFYGLSKRGNRRWALSTKDGNKNYYKGTGSSGVGRWTTRGRYLVNWEKVRTYVVPSSLDSTMLRPLVCATAPKIRNSFKGYSEGPIDGKLYIQKLREFVKYGTEEAPEAARNEKNYIERG